MRANAETIIGMMMRVYAALTEGKCWYQRKPEDQDDERRCILYIRLYIALNMA